MLNCKLLVNIVNHADIVVIASKNRLVELEEEKEE